MFPPAEFNIVKIHIHPPYADVLIQAFQKLLDALTPDELKGLIILHKSGHIRIPA